MATTTTATERKETMESIELKQRIESIRKEKAIRCKKESQFHYKINKILNDIEDEFVSPEEVPDDKAEEYLEKVNEILKHHLFI